MSKIAKSTGKGTGADAVAAKEPGLVSEALSAPESHWFIALLRSSGVYLTAISVYLGVAAALITAFGKVFAQPGENARSNIWAPASVLALAILFAAIFNVLPALRRRRERSLRTVDVAAVDYFSTAPREEGDPYCLFAAGYEAFLAWAKTPRAPLLHLTGLSGSGKSSLVAAYLAPHLQKPASGPRTRVIVLRSYADPLLALKEALLPFWKKPPEGYETLSAHEALCRAARKLEDGERLLVVFDQFEEYFLLRATAAPAQNTLAELVMADAELASLRDFFCAYLDKPPAGVSLLLVYREDHRRLIAPLNLPARQERVNWMPVEPLDFAAATRFLKSCPGLSVPQGRMERVLREAARQEGGRVVMRPIVANLLGLILQRMSDHPTLWRRTGDLLRGYVRDCLGQEVAEDRVRVLRSLLTDFHTARPRSVSELSKDAHLNPATLSQQLEALGHAGLLRCLDMQKAESERTWQIAHDFLATLIERALDGFHRPLWRMLRPWVAPITFVVAFAVGFVWPWLRKQQDITTLTNAGLTWNENSRAIKSARVIFLFTGEANVFSSIHRLHPWELDLSYPSIKDVRVLRGLIDLRVLNLSNSKFLIDLKTLIDLRNLSDLDLSNCEALRSVEGLRNLSKLNILVLRNCKALGSFDGLQGLTNLEFLDMDNCLALKNVDGLRGLTNLFDLDMSDCRSLKDVNGLRGLINLETLNMSNCGSLKDVNGLRGLVNIKRLDMSNCESLEDVNGLRGLINLEWLDMSFCEARKDVAVLRGLTKIRQLNLMNCKALKSVEPLRDLTDLQTLEISNCSALNDVEALQSLTKLVFLDLYGCDLLTKEDRKNLKKWLPATDIIFPDGSRE